MAKDDGGGSTPTGTLTISNQSALLLTKVEIQNRNMIPLEPYTTPIQLLQTKSWAIPAGKYRVDVTDASGSFADATVDITIGKTVNLIYSSTGRYGTLSISQ
jgi:hypothetical protein